jgi:hypothetical protein
VEGEEAVPYIVGEADGCGRSDEPHQIDVGEQHVDSLKKRKIGIKTASLKEKIGARALLLYKEKVPVATNTCLTAQFGN